MFTENVIAACKNVICLVAVVIWERKESVCVPADEKGDWEQQRSTIWDCVFPRNTNVLSWHSLR